MPILGPRTKSRNGQNSPSASSLTQRWYFRQKQWLSLRGSQRERALEIISGTRSYRGSRPRCSYFFLTVTTLPGLVLGSTDVVPEYTAE
jgi:hypothetical protein